MIDPTTVVRSALQNAASIASFLLTTEAVISLTPERDHNTAASMAAWLLVCTDRRRARTVHQKMSLRQ